jgi:hypothetical protein
MDPADVKYWMGQNQVQTATTPQEAKPVDLEAMLKAMAEAVPQEYMLIDPHGRVFQGPNPMVLAAQAMPRDQPFRF